MPNKGGYTTLWHDHFGSVHFVVAVFAIPILFLVHFGADLFGTNFMNIIFFVFFFFQFFFFFFFYKIFFPCFLFLFVFFFQK